MRVLLILFAISMAALSIGCQSSIGCCGIGCGNTYFLGDDIEFFPPVKDEEKLPEQPPLKVIPRNHDFLDDRATVPQDG